MPAVAPIVRVTALFAVVGVTLTLTGPASATGAIGPAQPTAAPTGDCEVVDAAAIADLAVTEAIDEIEDLSTLSAALVATDLDELLADGDEFTVFAPADEAFDAIPENVFEWMLTDLDVLSSILGYHVVVGQRLSAEELIEAGTIETASGPLEVAAAGDSLVVNGDRAVLCADIETANATVHVVDRVLQPVSSAITTGGSSVPGSSVPS